MSSNGNISTSELSPITGGVSGPDPGQGQLADNAAAAWNAMAVEIHSHTGKWIGVNGSDSAYRPYSRQVYWRNYWCSLGQCQNAAVPGTSNHGWGLAVDVPDWVTSLMQQYGGKYGWSKSCSDAPWENWHWKWCGGWSGPDPGPYGSGGGGGGTKYPFLKIGSKNHKAVKRLQRRLQAWNNGLIQPKADGDFGKHTRDAVRQFQVVHGLDADGEVGKKTWHVLRRKDIFTDPERIRINKIKWYQHRGIWKEKEKDMRQWCGRRAKHLWNVGSSDGWTEHLSARFKVMKKLGT